MVVNMTILCDAVEKMYVQSSLMKSLYIFELLAAITATFTALFTAVAIFCTTIYHFNARLLLSVQSLAFSITDAGEYCFYKFSMRDA